MPMYGNNVVIDDGGGGNPTQYTATLNLWYRSNYSDVTGLPSSSTYTRTGTNPNSYVTIHGTVSSSIPVKTGYDFIGWRQFDDDSIPLCQPGDDVAKTVQYGTTWSVPLYAIFAIKTYNITYYANGGYDQPSTQTKDYGATIHISSSIPSRDNYIFVKWNTSSDGTGVDYVPGQGYSDNESLNLYAVWAPSSSVPTVNKNSADIGIEIVISTNRIEPDAVHTLRYSIEGISGVIAENVTTSYTWTIPNSFYNLLPTKISSVCTILCDTYVAGTQLGTTREVSFTVTVPDRIKPSLSVSTSAVNEGDIATVIGTALVQGYSKISFTYTASAGQGANLTGFILVGQDLPSGIGLTDTTVVTNILSGAGTLIWTVYATDSRGRSSDVVTISANVSAYSRPTISPIAMNRCDQYGNQNQATGTYLNTRAFYSAANVGSNTITSAKVYYRRAGSGSWTEGIDLTSQTGAGSGMWTGAFGGGNIAIEYSYEVKYEIQDSIGAATSQNAVYIVSYPMPSSAGISYGILNDRLRLGGLVDEPGLVVDWASKFKNVFSIFDLNSNGMSAVITGEGDNISLLLTGNK